MRNFVMLAVAAGLVLPTAASAQRGPENRRGPQAETREARGNQDSFGGQIAAQVARADQQRREEQRDRRPERREERREDRRDARQDVREDRRDARQDARQDRRENWREDRREDRRDWRQDRREDRRDAREDRREYRQDVRRDQRQARRAYRDWRAYRQAERHAFRRGAYYAPRGYYYRPVRVGGLLSASVFWGQRYWIDPYDYYLPQPSRYYQRWIRYGNDVLLIDTRNGRVLVVYDNFFW